MLMREEIEKLLADVQRRRADAEAEAGHAAESLARLTSGMTPLEQVDAEQVGASADTFVEAVGRLRMLQGFARELRTLLM